MYYKIKILSIAILLLALIFGGGAPQVTFAGDIETATEVPQPSLQMPVMPTVTVEASRLISLSNTVVIDKKKIEALPRSNANLTELLKTVPGIQFSESTDNSRTGGEIRPPEISISGGRTSENSYIFDGASNNSLLDPDFTNYHNANNLPGHSQRLFLLDHLVEDVTVLRGNIPARYGSFTGGVVEVNSINPDTEFKGEISYRTTRSDWGQFYIDPEKEEDFYNSISADDQPSFVKHQTSMTLHIPLNETMGLLLDYSRIESSIPISAFEQKKVQRRRNENFFLKYLVTPQTGTEIRLSTTYAPYQGDYNLSKTLDSNYTLIGGGFKIDAGLNHRTEIGQLEFNMNFQTSQNSREAPNNWYSWRTTPSKDWGTPAVASMEGGFGDLEKLERSVGTNLHLTLNELKSGPVKHTIGFGTELSYTQATFDRTEEYTQYVARLADGSRSYYPVLPCPPGDTLCIEGEQFMYYKNTRPVNEAHAGIFNFQTYVEDQLSINQLSLRPGLRVSYENYQKNLNFAPRIAASYDVFGNHKTILISGYNRYYGVNLLALELESKQANIIKACRGEIKERVSSVTGAVTYSCDTKTVDPKHDWTIIPKSTVSASRVSDLKTPYSDEFTLGIQQSLLGGRLELLYIDREYKDQIVSVILDKDEDGYIFKEWRNSGRRTHEEVSLSWQKSWKKHFLSLNVTWEETKSNSSSYTDTFDEHQIDDEPDELDLPVWYDGKLTDRSQVPINDYNRPYKASLVYSVNLPFKLSFTNTTNLRSRYRVVDRITSGEVEMPDGSMVNVRSLDNDYYDKVTKPSALTFDWKVAWQSPEWHGNSAEITLDILNVFNRRVEIGTADGEYLLGRQYWAGLTYKF
ncbi:MAG: TonB-dependent receptor plug domain-containing protein [Desulfuromonadales bacterium]|nr:TonB-dependent receptor plug domain-containing protein [Desulfuromonadales bacterium]